MDRDPNVLDCARGIYPPEPEETPRETFDREFAELRKAVALLNTPAAPPPEPAETPAPHASADADE